VRLIDYSWDVVLLERVLRLSMRFFDWFADLLLWKIEGLGRCSRVGIETLDRYPLRLLVCWFVGFWLGLMMRGYLSMV
jgi:hypothetical protein